MFQLSISGATGRTSGPTVRVGYDIGDIDFEERIDILNRLKVAEQDKSVAAVVASPSSFISMTSSLALATDPRNN